MSIQLKTASINGKQIAYSSETKFLIQIGKGPKGSYKNLYVFDGDLERAIFNYKCINIGNVYKKRIYVPSFNKPVLARAKS
jgi:hypothetical protein